MMRNSSKKKSALMAACFLIAGNIACLSSIGQPSLPTLPVDAWDRGSGPVLTAGSRSADGLLDISIGDPDAYYDSATGIWHLWYQTGRATSYTASDNRMVIRHAQSADGGSSWSVDAAPALALPGNASAWDATHTETPSVVFDSAAPADRHYKLYYSGASGNHPMGFPNYQIGMAISADGKIFKRLPAGESPYCQEGLVLRAVEALPDLKGLADGIVADPEVQLIDGTYHLWFSSFANDAGNKILAFGISHATSMDGIHWTPSPGNPVPSLRNANNAGGQQPSVAWNPVLQRWEMWFTSDSDQEKALIPSTFNPAFGFWMATSTDASTWRVDYKTPRDSYWRPGSPEEAYGLLTGADVVIVDRMRHMFYTGWGNRNIPEGFIVPVRDARSYVPAVLNLFHATKPADR